MQGDFLTERRKGIERYVRIATLALIATFGVFILWLLRLAPQYVKAEHPLEVESTIAILAAVVIVAMAGGSLWLAQGLGRHAALLDTALRIKTAELVIANDKLAETVSDLQAASRMKEDLLANVSHELRTPLTLIKAAASALGRPDTVLKPEKRAQLLSQIERAIERLIRLVEDLLAYSRIEARSLRLNIEASDFGQLVDQTIALLLPLAVSKGITIAVNTAEAPKEAWIDRARITQVVINLVDNAIKFTPSGARIDISVARDGEMIVTEVKDTGGGISAEALPHIFERFYQADQTMTRHHGGTGLGLAVVKSLIELHGGEIKVCSEIGKGTQFRVSIPIGPPASEGSGGDG